MAFEEKMEIVINNYFKKECSVNTSIREAFEKGFRIGVKKGRSAQREVVHCRDCVFKELWGVDWYCNHITGEEIMVKPSDYCSWGEREKEGNDG